jgi:ubiquinone biosynthesis protein
MRISSIPQIYRHLNRWGDILAVLSRYELANWVSRLGPDFAKDLLKSKGGETIARYSWETRVRLALGELGPTFVKLGQILSTRPDLAGAGLARELQHLQADVPADPPEVARQTVAEELGAGVDELFAEFDDVPLASASIGQVHRAKLRSGELVAVKVQHADIQRKIAVDMDILAGLAQLAERLPEFQNYQPRAIVAEFQRAIRRELDFEREARNMEQFARDLDHNPHLRIPRPYHSLSTARVLTMEHLEGTKVAEIEELVAKGLDLNEVARAGADICLEMIFANGFYHADPHPSNLILMDDEVIGLLDFGMVGRLDDALQEDMGELIGAVAEQDAEHLTSIIIRVGQTPGELDRSSLSADVADFVAHYGSQPLHSFDLSGALIEMTEIIRRYNITLPPRIGMLIKALVTLDGTTRLLSPDFCLIEVIKPYQQKLFWRRYSPMRQARKLRRLYGEIEHLVQILPQSICDILQQVETGKFDVHLDHRGLEPSVNRLVLGMLASALFVGSSLMLSRNVPPLLYVTEHALSVPGTFGMGLSLVLGLRLWRAINKSGRLDRRQ